MTTAPSQLGDLLPPNATPLQRALSLAAARTLEIDAETVARGSLALRTDAGLLSPLAWERSVDTWSAAWTLDQKRQVVHGAFAYHQRKGTPGALNRALAQLAYQPVLSEWFQHGGDPYTFRLKVALPLNGHFTVAEAQALLSVVNRAKNARSYLDRLELASAAQGPGPYVACWGRRRARAVRLLPEAA